MASYPEMKGKIALVTGGSSGIGLATVAAFADQGATVILASRDKKRADVALKSIKSPANVSWMACDVSRARDVAKLCAAIGKKHGRLDYAFNNGGSGARVGPVASGDEAAWLTTSFRLLRCKKVRIAAAVSSALVTTSRCPSPFIT